MKIRPVGAELFHVDGRTDMTKLVLAFRNFANAPRNQIHPVSLFISFLMFIFYNIQPQLKIHDGVCVCNFPHF